MSHHTHSESTSAFSPIQPWQQLHKPQRQTVQIHSMRLIFKGQVGEFQHALCFQVFFPCLGLMCFVLCFQVFVESPEGLPCVRWRQQHRCSSERGQWRRYEWLDHTSCNTFHHLEESCWGKENSCSELFHCRNIQQTGLESCREFI